MSQGFLCYLCISLSLSYYSLFIHLSKLLYAALFMALNMKEFLSTGRFLQEYWSSKSFHGLPTQVLALPIKTKTFDWAESKCHGQILLNNKNPSFQAEDIQQWNAGRDNPVHYSFKFIIWLVSGFLLWDYVTALQQWMSGFVTAHHKVARLMSSTPLLCTHSSMWPLFSQENLTGIPHGNPRLSNEHLASCDYSPWHTSQELVGMFNLRCLTAYMFFL